ncbi:MAG: c-type cytochrome [Pirellulales bacterium]
MHLLIAYLHLVSIVGIGSSFPLRAADDVELPDFLPGLVASFEGGKAAHRIDMIPRLHWDADRDGIAPDLRLNNEGQVEVRWSGLLQIKSAGEYRLSVMAVGKGSIQIDGRELLAFQSSEVRRHETASLPLESRSYNLVIRYKSPPRKAELGLYWQGSDFRLEPLSERFLSHRTQDHPTDAFERGRLLSQALNCTACHRLEQNGRRPNRSANATVDAPSLKRVAMNVKTDWLVERLMSRGGQSAEASRPAILTAVAAEDDITRRMPHFAMTQGDARAVAAALFQLSRAGSNTEKKSEDVKPTKTDATKKPDSGQDKSKNKKKERTEPDAAEGKRLIASRGCVACHAISSLGIGAVDDEDESNWLPHRRLENLRKNLFSGGDLSLVQEKRPAGFIAAWLADPAARITNHRMPKFELSDLERRDIERFLQASSEQSSFQEPSESDLNRGRTLIAKWRCGACHELPAGLNVDEPLDAQHKSAAELTQIAKTHDSMHSVWGDKSCLASAARDERARFRSTRKCCALQLYWQTAAHVARR